MDKFRFLIVEDNDYYRKFLRDIFHKNFPEIEIDEAADGREALQKVDSFFPDLIFMDIRLPDESGLEVTKKIKAIHSGIHIVIPTYYDLPEYQDAAFRYGADHFLVKSSLATNIESIISFMN